MTSRVSASHLSIGLLARAGRLVHLGEVLLLHLQVLGLCLLAFLLRALLRVQPPLQLLRRRHARILLATQRLAHVVQLLLKLLADVHELHAVCPLPCARLYTLAQPALPHARASEQVRTSCTRFSRCCLCCCRPSRWFAASVNAAVTLAASAVASSPRRRASLRSCLRRASARSVSLCACCLMTVFSCTTSTFSLRSRALSACSLATCSCSAAQRASAALCGSGAVGGGRSKGSRSIVRSWHFAHVRAAAHSSGVNLSLLRTSMLRLRVSS